MTIAIDRTAATTTSAWRSGRRAVVRRRAACSLRTNLGDVRLDGLRPDADVEHPAHVAGGPSAALVLSLGARARIGPPMGEGPAEPSCAGCRSGNGAARRDGGGRTAPLLALHTCDRAARAGVDDRNRIRSGREPTGGWDCSCSSGAGAPATDTRALALGRKRARGALLSAQSSEPWAMARSSWPTHTGSARREVTIIASGSRWCPA